MLVPSANSRIYRWLRRGLGVVVAAGVILALLRLLRHWDGSEVHVRLLPLALSVAVLLVANVVQALGWKFLLERMAGSTVALRPLLSVFMSGQLARYLPGKVGLPMVRIAGAAKLGVSARLIAASVGIEVAAWIGVGTLVGCTALLCNLSLVSPIPGLDRNWLWLCSILILLGLLAALLLDRNRFPAWMLRVLRAEGQGPFVSLLMISMQLLAWLGWWVLGLLILIALGSSIHVAITQAGIFILAPILGFLAMVAPGGLGVRETAISYALAPHVGASAALSAAVLARAAAIASELLGWLIAVTWERRDGA